MRCLAIDADRSLECLYLRPENKPVTCQNGVDCRTNWLGKDTILFAKIEQRHPHGAKSMAASVFGSIRTLQRNIGFQPVRQAGVRACQHDNGIGQMLRGLYRDRLPGCLGRQSLTLHFEQVSLSTMAFLRGIFWLVLFIVLAFCFVVLFEYGPRDFANGSKKEFARAKSFVVKQTEKLHKPKK